MTRCSRLGPLLLGAAILLGACGGDGDASGVTVPDDGATTSTSTTTASTTTTDPDAEVEEAIEQAYYDQFEAFVEIFKDPDPTNPLIDEFFMGEQREQLLDAISRNVAEDTALRRPSNSDHYSTTVLSIEPSADSAVVTACVVDGLLVIRESSGEVLNDVVATLQLRLTFERHDGRWKVSKVSQEERREGAQECDS